MLSEFLKSRMKDAKALCNELRKTFKYVSVLGTDVRVQSVMANRMSTSIQDEGLGSECGFVVKMKNDNAFFEYSLDDILGDKEELAKKIISSLKIDEELEKKMIQTGDILDEPLEESFIRDVSLSVLAYQVEIANQKLKAINDCSNNLLFSNNDFILNFYENLLKNKFPNIKKEHSIFSVKGEEKNIYFIPYYEKEELEDKDVIKIIKNLNIKENEQSQIIIFCIIINGRYLVWNMLRLES